MYIHHGLSANADHWADFCLQQCLKCNIPFEVQKVQLNPAANIEAQARAARYSALAAFVTTPQTALLTAHHADDQLETLLLALKRGAGPAGLSGIAALQPFAAGWLLRPLLEFSREQLDALQSSNSLPGLKTKVTMTADLIVTFCVQRSFRYCSSAGRPLGKMRCAL